MACKCQNADGKISDMCLCACKLEIIVEKKIQQYPYLLKEFTELVLAQVEKCIDLKVSQLRIEFDSKQMSPWDKPFIEDLREAINLRAELGEDD